MTTVRISDDSLALACGADALAEAFKKAGAHIQRVSSWGMHWLEPLVEINGIGWGPVELDDVAAILEGKCEEKCIGPVAAFPWIASQQRLTFARAGKTRPLSLDDYAATGGWEGWKRVRTLTPEQVIAEVTESGLRGRGGAGFPAGIKWKTVAGATADQKYVVCNADEGDSATFADRMLMEGDPFQLIEGMAIAAYASVRPAPISTRAANIPTPSPRWKRRSSWPRRWFRPSSSKCGRRRRLCLRRGNLAAQQPGRQARRSARQAAAPCPPGPVRQADGSQQRPDHRRHSAHQAEGGAENMRAWASSAPRAPSRSRSPAM